MEKKVCFLEAKQTPNSNNTIIILMVTTDIDNNDNDDGNDNNIGVGAIDVGAIGVGAIGVGAGGSILVSIFLLVEGGEIISEWRSSIYSDTLL